MTIKDVILFLEEEKGEKYPHRIWAPMELTGEDYAAWGLSWEQMEADEMHTSNISSLKWKKPA